MIRNIYRVVLTSGMTDCYVHFIDKNADYFVLRHMEHGERQSGVA